MYVNFKQLTGLTICRNRNWFKLLLFIPLILGVSDLKAGEIPIADFNFLGLESNPEKLISKDIGSPNSDFYQQKKVSGTVIDQKGKPLQGVTVLIKGTNIGTTTLNDGSFSIDVPDNSILVFSFVGYKTQEISTENKTTISVVLSQIESGLETVVVVGYGTQRKRDVTGSIATVDFSREKSLPDINVAQALTGIAGVQFTNSGRPGQNGNILIRGQNSLSASNDPLIVLDGVIFRGSMSDINPDDVSSMDILKDASAAAIYGSRASNGVILITSKTGKIGKPAFSFNTFYGVATPSHEIKLLSPERYIQRRLDWRSESGLDADPSKIGDYLTSTEADNLKSGLSMNPWKLGTQNSWINSYDLGVGGGSESVKYYFGGAISNDHGLIFHDDQKRISIRSNIEAKLNDWLSVGINAFFVQRNLGDSSTSVNNIYRASPYGTPFYPDGAPTQFPVLSEAAGSNPRWAPFYTDKDEKYNNLYSVLHAIIKFPFLKGLSFQTSYSPNFVWHNYYFFTRQDPHVAANLTNAAKTNENNFNWDWENILKYTKVVGDNNFDITLLYSRDHTKTESTSLTGSQFGLGVLGYNNIGLANIINGTSDASRIEDVSGMARINYQYKSRYLVTLTGRRDGSSVFSSNRKYAFFPSVAMGWVVSDEPFFPHAGFINMLKARLSYGSVGNQAISPYQSLTLSTVENYVFGNNASRALAAVSSSLGNNNLKWEITHSLDAALDFQIFRRKLSGTIDYYMSNTFDLLVLRNIPIMNGFQSVLTNIGQVRNSGIELTLNSDNIETRDFKWTSTFSFSYNKNKIIHLFKTDLDHNGREDDDVANSWFIGQPINSYFNFVFDGIYQANDTHIPAGQQPGFVRFKDINGDGTISASDRAIIGSGVNPKFKYFLANAFEYKKLTLNIAFNAMTGWIAPFNLINPLVPNRALNQYDGGWWTPENKSNSRPSLTYANPLGASWYISRNFLRISDVSLAYNVGIVQLRSLKASSLDIYFSIKNLHTFTGWPGSDPEVGGDYSSVQGTPQMYPLPRTYTLGFRLGF